MAKYAATLVSMLVLLLGVGLATAAGPLDGRAVVQARNLAESTVQIADHVYQITPETTLRWEDGRSFQLADLQLPEIGHREGLWPLYIGSYEAVETHSGLVLISLEITNSPE